jgi:hypothetical protein
MGRRLTFEERLARSFVLEPLPKPEVAGKTALKCANRRWAQLPTDATRFIQQLCGTPVREEVPDRRARRLELLLKARPWEPREHVKHKTPLERIIGFREKPRKPRKR